MSKKRLTKRGKITIGIFILLIIIGSIYVQKQDDKPSKDFNRTVRLNKDKGRKGRLNKPKIKTKKKGRYRKVGRTKTKAKF